MQNNEQEKPCCVFVRVQRKYQYKVVYMLDERLDAYEYQNHIRRNAYESKPHNKYWVKPHLAQKIHLPVCPNGMSGRK